MVYTVKVDFLVTTSSPEFDPETGNTITRGLMPVSRTCKVYDLSTERKAMAFGRVDINAKAIIHPGTAIFADYVEIDHIRYAVRSYRRLRGKAAYIVEQVLA